MLIGKNSSRKIRFWWNLSLAFFQKYKTRLVLTAVAIFLIGILLPRLINTIFSLNTISIGYVGTNTLENVPTDVLSLVTGSLVKTDESGRPQPSIASSWQISDGGKKYVVFLKDNLRWHDDTPVVAKDISLAISNVQINALNDKSIQFILPNSIPSFLLALDKPVFKSGTFYGTGKYRIVKIDKVGGIIRKIYLYPKTQGLPNVNIKFYPNGTQAQQALKIGEIQSLTVANAQEFTKWPNLKVAKKVNRNEIVTVFYNNEYQALSQKEVREALSYAINRSNFDGEMADSPISKSSWAYNENVKHYEYNVASAKELLSKGTNQKITINLSYTNELEPIAKSIRDDWEAIGVRVNLKLEKNVPKNFQALLAIDSLPPDPDQYALWHSTQTKTNITNYKNVKIDKLLEDGRSTLDENQRKGFYMDFQKFLVEDAPATFLYYPNEYTITYKNSQKKLEAIQNQ